MIANVDRTTGKVSVIPLLHLLKETKEVKHAGKSLGHNENCKSDIQA